MGKIGVAVLMVALLVISSSAYALKVNKHTIEVVIDRQGNGSVTETYNLYFYAGEKEEFEGNYQEFGSNLTLWKTKYDWIYPNILEYYVDAVNVTYAGATSQVILEYNLNRKLATVSEETAREETWDIPDSVLQQFQVGGTIFVPQDVEIRIVLPVGSEVATDKLSKQANISGRTILLSGISTNFLNLEYVIGKPIAPPVNPGSIINESNMLVAASVILLAALLVYWKRKPLSDKVEGYVVENSEIIPKSAEEVDIDA